MNGYELLNVVVFQVDHCEDDMKTTETLLPLADKAAGTLEERCLRAFHAVIVSTIQRRHKKRVKMNQVYTKFSDNANKCTSCVFFTQVIDKWDEAAPVRRL